MHRFFIVLVVAVLSTANAFANADSDRADRADRAAERMDRAQDRIDRIRDRQDRRNHPQTCTAINAAGRRFKVTALPKKNPCKQALNTCRKQSRHAAASCRYTNIFEDIFY